MSICLRLGAALAIATAASLVAACGDDKTPATPADEGRVADVVTDAPVDAGPSFAAPVPDPDAAARAFKLFYRERVDRALVAYQRYGAFGGTTFALHNGKARASRKGDRYEVVVGPTDNNRLGRTLFATWQAWRTFKTPVSELALRRLLEGYVFFEAVSGHPGITSREALPGWTITIDGIEGKVSRVRGGQEVSPPTPPDEAFEQDVIRTFFDGVHMTYRLDPEELYFSFMPAVEVDQYALTYSFSALPHYLRASDCCSSLMRTPAPHAWEGAYWGNHNSRDNFPDLGIGYVTAMAISKDEGAPAKLRALAEEVVAGGRRIATSIVESGGALMTVDEHNPYDKLVVAGALRPDGVVEPEDLGSLAFCGMAYLAQAMSSEGLDLPVPARPVPGSYEHLIDTLPSSIQTNCEVPEGVKLCVSLDDAFCGFTWSEIDKLELFGVPWLDAIEAAGVGLAEELLGSFQDDFSEMVDTTVALALYAQVAGRPELEREAKELVGEMGAIMRRFGELLWKESNPDRLRRQRYEAALKEAIAGVGPAVEDLGELDEAEAHIKRIEGQLELAETEPAPLLSDEEIKKRIDDRLADKRSNQYDYVVAERYEAEYGSEYPVRRTESGYEARGFPFEEHPWKAVEVPSHRYVGGGHLLEALALCQSAPTVLDCTWAVLGCAAADFDGSGVVDEKDALIFYSAEDRHAGMGPGSCTEENQRCDGADLDLTGEVDDLDTRFFETATGCRR